MIIPAIKFMSIFRLLLTCTFVFCTSSNSGPGTPPKIAYDVRKAETLYDKLFNNCHNSQYQICNTYNTELAPIWEGKAVDVRVQTYFIELIDFDSQHQVLNVALWLEMIWQDNRLKWDDKDPNDPGYGINALTVEPGTIWKPDMVLYTGITQDGFRIDTQEQVKAIITSDGKISWTPLLYHQVSCPMHSKYFPFDVQICYLKWSSWSSDKNQLDLRLNNNSSDVNINYQLENVIFTMTKSLQHINEITYASGRTYQDVKMIMYFKRNYTGFMLTIILNSLLLCFICLVSFLIPISTGERLSLSLSVVIAITVYQIIAAEMLPIGTDTIPTLSIFLFCQCLLVYFSVFVTMVNMQYECRDHTDSPNETLFKFMVKFLGKIMKIHDLEMYKKFEFLEKRVKFHQEVYEDVMKKWKAHQREKKLIRMSKKYFVLDLKDDDTLVKQRWVKAISNVMWNNKNKKLKKTLRRTERQLSQKFVQKIRNIRPQHEDDDENKTTMIDRFKDHVITHKHKGSAEYHNCLENQLANEKWNLISLALDRCCMSLYFLCFLALGIWTVVYGNSHQSQMDYYEKNVLPGIMVK